MPVLSEARIAELLTPYLSLDLAPDLAPGGEAGPEALTRSSPEELYGRLSAYLDLLAGWNARTNLTAVREPEAMVQRHFGESLFAAERLGRHLVDGGTVLDFGTGGGFPGIPLQLLYPELRVTLAESQGKKAAFLREVVRMLGLSSEVWAERVEAMGRERRFGAVTMRAVDRMKEMVVLARARVETGGWLLQMIGEPEATSLAEVYRLPQAEGSYVYLEPVR